MQKSVKYFLLLPSRLEKKSTWQETRHATHCGWICREDAKHCGWNCGIPYNANFFFYFLSLPLNSEPQIHGGHTTLKKGPFHVTAL